MKLERSFHLFLTTYRFEVWFKRHRDKNRPGKIIIDFPPYRNDLTKADISDKYACNLNECVSRHYVFQTVSNRIIFNAYNLEFYYLNKIIFFFYLRKLYFKSSQTKEIVRGGDRSPLFYLVEMLLVIIVICTFVHRHIFLFRIFACRPLMLLRDGMAKRNNLLGAAIWNFVI